VIVTFYSYKGGVGRSMALANIADQLARSGMRVLMVDFDLEAPGLEHFFPIDHERVRGREGLLDLLLAFKYAMSVASSASAEGEEDAYRDLDRYISTIYPPRSDGGRLDLIPAGLRLTNDQMTRYGAELRRFDWQDFYYVWSGELFFEWFRRTCAERYDVVLVDSRTGVTELGGVCAYQLADVIVALCAANLQNVEGTALMARHFLSPQVKAVRGDRPLEVLVVPARVEQQDPEQLADFAGKFRHEFDPLMPSALSEAGLSFWELQVPYVPAYAFDEQVVTDPGRAEERRALVRAYGSLRNAIALLAPEGNGVAGLRPALVAEERDTNDIEPVETQYDPTSRFASADVLLSYHNVDREAAYQIQEVLALRGGLQVVMAIPGEPWATSIRAKVSVLLVSSAYGMTSYYLGGLQALAARGETSLLPVLLPGADRPPEELRNYAYLDCREGLDTDHLLEAVRAGLEQWIRSSEAPRYDSSIPYPGAVPFAEANERVFFGRDELVNRVVETLRQHGTCAVTGWAGSGRTSLVNAGVLPALRAGLLPGSESWPIVRVHEDGRVPELETALNSLTNLPARSRRVVVVIDSLDQLFASAADDHRAALINTLEALTDPVILPLTVVRTDYVAPLALMGVGFLMAGSVEVTPMSAYELRQTVEMPAQAMGLVLEPGLTDRLLQDAGDDPSALPLLQQALHNMWLRRSEGYLTHHAFVATGGVQGSLASSAEGWLDQLPPNDKERARELLLHLVTINSDKQPQRRPVSTAAIATAGVTDLCEQMLQRRLLINSYGDRAEYQVQLSHPALMETWPRLRRWIAEARSALELRQKLSEAAEDWEQSGKVREGLLGRQGLAHAKSITSTLMLGDLEILYVAVSQADDRRKRKLDALVPPVMLALTGALVLIAQFSDLGDTAKTWIFAPALLGSVAVIASQLLTQSRRERRSLTL